MDSHSPGLSSVVDGSEFEPTKVMMFLTKESPLVEPYIKFTTAMVDRTPPLKFSIRV